MDRNELARRLMATFLEEVHEHVEAVNANLLALEADPPQERRYEILRCLFRSVHSLKGASQAVNVDLIERACHCMEDILAPIRDGNHDIPPPIFSLLFRLADAVADAAMRLRDEQDLEDGPLQSLLPQLEESAAAAAASPKAARDDKATDAHELTGQRGQPVASASLTETCPATAPASPDPPASGAPAPSVAAATSAAPVGTSIRVQAEKLDSLLSQAGELLVVRRRVEYRASDATALRESLTRLRAEWRELERALRGRLSDSDQETSTPSASRRPRHRRDAAVVERTTERLAELERDAERLAAGMVSDGRLFAQTCDVLQDEVHHVRMLPFAAACGGLERAVRDIARATGKEMSLIIEGADVEVDRSVLEAIKDPLLHLVRNAADHGIESPGDRQACGKPARAQITVSAALRGGRVEVVVADDGRGFDLGRIREQALKRGVPVPQDERDLARVVFLPGMSTAPIVTDVSGRGVGLDVVESRIQSVHGFVDVTFEKGVGTQFKLDVPLTLTTIRCVLAVAGENTYALPTSNVQQLVRFDQASVKSVSGRDMLLMGDAPIPIGSLAGTLGQDEQAADARNDKLLALVLTTGTQRVALLVDDVTGEQEVLVKNLGSRIRSVRHVSGATLLPSGNVALVLNVANLLRTALGQATARRLASERVTTEVEQKKRLLIVEDSMTTRALMKSILETVGYEVLTAVDGQQAWQLMSQQQVDLVVSDLDMPRMDGFELTSAIRGSKQHASLPVILLTARETDEDKSRGIQVGANAYLAKRRFDQSNLLETIEQLL